MKQSNTHWIVLVLLLVAVGASTFAYKVSYLGFPATPDRESVTWTVEARISLEPRDGPVTLSLKLPGPVAGFKRLREGYVSKGFGRTVREENGARIAEWTIRRMTEASALYYRGTFYADPSAAGWSDTPAYPQPPQLEEPYDSALEAVVEDIRARSADIESFALRVVEHLNDTSPDENTQLFQALIDAGASKVSIARQILAAARIPTDTVHAVRLEEQRRRAELLPWLAVHNGGRWLYIDLATASSVVPDDLFFWWRGDTPVAVASGAHIADTRISVRRDVMGALDFAARRAAVERSVHSKISLLNLPLESQAVYGILLLVPLGAFLIVLLRNVIGVRTFGTFMPVLIAMAFRETELVNGIVLFAFIVGVGLLIRFYLEQLRLLLVPRLAAVLTIVVLLMVSMSVASHATGFEFGLSVSLFPMVIMAMTIERMSIVWDERGPAEAIKDGVGSLMVAAVAYLVMSIELVQHLVLVFPELLLVVLGCTIMLGRYTGYRLSELGRFRRLADFSGSTPSGPA